MIEQVGQPQVAIALPDVGLEVAGAEQPGQPAPAVAVHRIGDDVRRIVGEAQPRARHQAEGVEHRQPFARQQPAVLGRLRRLLLPHQLVLGVGREDAPRLAQAGPGAHHAGHRIAVGDADAGMAEGDSLGHHVRRVRRAVEEGIVSRGHQLGEGAVRRLGDEGHPAGRIVVQPREGRGLHANSPCRYQPGIG